MKKHLTLIRNIIKYRRIFTLFEILPFILKLPNRHKIGLSHTHNSRSYQSFIIGPRRSLYSVIILSTTPLIKKEDSTFHS